MSFDKVGSLIENGSGDGNVVWGGEDEENYASQGEEGLGNGAFGVGLERFASEKSLPLLLKNNNIVRWDSDMPLLKRILLDLNNFVSQHLNEGFTLNILQKLSTWPVMMGHDCEDCG